VAGLHESSVQTLLSLQFSGGPPRHAPPAHVSAVVHASPSSHGEVLFVWTHPVAGLHESSVQTLPSLQFGGAPPRQVPPAHVSAVVHASPSSHGVVLSVCTRPVAGLHASSVQTLPSLQLGGGPPRHAPPAHVSAVVHAFPSSQGEVLFVWTQPVAGLHGSSVRTLWSLRFGGAPPRHAPLAQVSAVVHAFPSSQGEVLFVWTHPVAGLHESSVQTLPSLQFGGAPPRQVPPTHVSAVVQSFPSSHGEVLFVWTHPVAGLH